MSEIGPHPLYTQGRCNQRSARQLSLIANSAERTGRCIEPQHGAIQTKGRVVAASNAKVDYGWSLDWLAPLQLPLHDRRRKGNTDPDQVQHKGVSYIQGQRAQNLH